MNRVVECKHCGRYEYYGEMRWLNGCEWCRKCYKRIYERIHKKPYEWDDLDGPTPTPEEIMEALNA